MPVTTRSAAKRPRNNAKPSFFTGLPPNVLKQILKVLSRENMNRTLSTINSPNNRTRNIFRHELRGRELKNLLINGNIARYYNPELQKVLNEISKHYPNATPLNNWGTTIGDHRRRANSSRAKLNALRLRAGRYYNTRPTENSSIPYRYNDRHGNGYLYTNRGGTTRAVMKGLKRTRNGGLTLKN